jgi:hypothetical protein
MHSHLFFRIHYATTPQRVSLLPNIFKVNPRSWRFLSQQVADLFHGKVRIGNAYSVVFELAHECLSIKGAYLNVL